MNHPATQKPEDFDAIVIGAGMAGLYQLYRLRNLGMDVLVIEEAPEVGGTWYWNCYPGARFDSESYSYGFLFSKELFEDWNWSEHFAAQPETLRYLKHVADRFDLRSHIRFNSRVQQCVWDEANQRWTVRTGDGYSARARFVIPAVGVLSATYVPDFPGIDAFEGQAFHTSRWPQEGVDLAGKRVGVIGTGSTGVQIIQTIADEVDQLIVFQRTPTYCAPLRNAPITPAEQSELKRSYHQLVEKMRQTPGAFIHGPDERKTLDLTDEERLRFFEQRWAEPGFSKWLGLFSDTLSDRAANELYAQFVREKIRARVHDPATAEKLIPTHPFGAKRIPLETNYYETYNRSNVHLVDLRSEPIRELYSGGLRTQAHDYPLDVIIFATGFDSVSGNLVRIDIRGRNGTSLAESFKNGPHSYMGLGIHGFPNLLPISGPLGGFVFCNVPRCLEENVDWVTDCIAFMRENSYRVIEPTAVAEQGWHELVQQCVAQSILPGTDSWFYGANIPGKKKTIQMYVGGLIEFRKLYMQMVADGYEGFDLQ